MIYLPQFFINSVKKVNNLKVVKVLNPDFALEGRKIKKEFTNY